MKIGAKRFLSLMLCCIMVLGLFSVTAFAVDAEAGKTVTITKVWDDNGFNNVTRPNKVIINVFKDGVSVADQTVELNPENEWKGNFQAEADHNYTIEEESVPNYDV